MSFFKTKIKINEEALDVLEMITLSSIGNLVANKHPDWIDDMESWYALFQGEEDLEKFQDMYKHAIHALIEKVTDDELLQLQIKNIMALLKIDFEGPDLPELMTRYRKIVDAFMSGVKSARHGVKSEK